MRHVWTMILISTSLAGFASAQPPKAKTSKAASPSPFATDSAVASSPVSEAPLSSCKSVLAESQRQLWQCDQLKVLVVKGTPVERARLQGELLRSESSSHLSQVPLDAFADLMLSPWRDSPVTRWFVDLGLRFWTWLYDRKAPPSYHEELEALAKAAKVPGARVRRAMLFPDTAMFFWAFLDSSATKLGCTSAAKTTADGHFVYGRNLDFMGVDSYDLHPMLLVQLPADGSKELAHLAFGAEGLPFSGITGVNEAGISLAVHQNYTRDTHMGGVPLPYIGELVLRAAKSLDEAVELLRIHRPGPLWTFVLTDLKKGEVRAVEASREHFEVRRSEAGLFAQSNHSLHDNVRKDELIDIGTRANSLWRMQTALKILGDSKVASREAMASVLAWQKELTGEMSVHDDVLKPMTIQTVILDGDGTENWNVALSMDPTPSSSGRYAVFKAPDLWKALSGALAFSTQNPSGTPAEKRQKQVAAAQAYAATAELKIPRALELLSPQNSGGALLARTALTLQDHRPSDALALVRKAHESKSFAAEPLYIQQAFDWLELLSMAKLGNKELTVKRAAEVLATNPIDPKLSEVAAILAQGKKLSSHDEELEFDFFSGYFAYVPLKPEAWKALDGREMRQSKTP